MFSTNSLGGYELHRCCTELLSLLFQKSLSRSLKTTERHTYTSVEHSRSSIYFFHPSRVPRISISNSRCSLDIRFSFHRAPGAGRTSRGKEVVKNEEGFIHQAVSRDVYDQTGNSKQTQIRNKQGYTCTFINVVL